MQKAAIINTPTPPPLRTESPLILRSSYSAVALAFSSTYSKCTVQLRLIQAKPGYSHSEQERLRHIVPIQAATRAGRGAGPCAPRNGVIDRRVSPPPASR